MSPHQKAPSLVASLTKSVLFALLSGIVGPIFVVVALNTPEAPGWLLATGIGVTALVVAVGLLVGFKSYTGKKRRFRLATTGRVARGDVQLVEPTSVSINDQPVVRIALRIHGPGVTPFDVDAKKIIPVALTGLLHRGVVGVLVDPATKEFELDWQMTGLLTGSVPIVFTDVASGRDYDLTGQTDVILQVLEILHRYGLPLDNLTDLRNHPQARSEIMRLAHTHGQAPAPSAPSPVVQTGPAPSAVERLTELDRLYSNSLITESEYLTTRQRILDGL